MTVAKRSQHRISLNQLKHDVVSAKSRTWCQRHGEWRRILRNTTYLVWGIQMELNLRYYVDQKPETTDESSFPETR